MKRLFLALWPDSETRSTICKLTQHPDLKYGKLVAKHNYHITLVFIGSVPDTLIPELSLRFNAVTINPFVTTFDAIEYWSKPKVLCLTSSHPSERLMGLAANLDIIVRECGIETDSRAYQPHITLARKVHGMKQIEFEPVNWSSESFSLLESVSTPEGVLYRVLHTWS